jgi:DNA-binding transcriptional ArsR family regulator
MTLDYFAERRNKDAHMTPPTISKQRHQQRAAVFKALGHPARLQIVAALGEGERCVCDLVEAVGSGWSTVSRHLTVLKTAGILADEKRGLQVFYRLKLPCVNSFAECLDAAKSGQAVEVRRCCG